MVFTFLGTIANWIDEDWELLERVVDFRRLGEDQHTGAGGARAFLDGLKKIGIATKISSPFIYVPSVAYLCHTLMQSPLITSRLTTSFAARLLASS